MLHMAIRVKHLTEFIISIKFKFQIQFVTFIRGDPETPMLGPAVNRQPGFRRGTRRAKQRHEEQPCWLAGRLAGWLARAVSGWLAGSGWLVGAGWVAG